MSCLDESPIATALEGDTVVLTTDANGTWGRETASAIQDGSVFAALPDRVLWMNEKNRFAAEILSLPR